MGLAPATCLPGFEIRHQKHLYLARFEPFSSDMLYQKQIARPETWGPPGGAVLASEDNDLHVLHG